MLLYAYKVEKGHIQSKKIEVCKKYGDSNAVLP